MTSKKNTTKEKIINDVIEIIGKTQNPNLTNREIAKETNINVAAINYHFGTKQKLFELIEIKFINDISVIHEQLKNTEVSSKASIESWANALFDYLVMFPGMKIMFANYILNNHLTSSNLLSQFNENYSDLRILIQEIIDIDDEQILMFKTSHIMSSIIMPLVNQSLFNELYLENIDNRKLYINSLIESIR